VLSDDCSTDDTFEIMREVVQGYAGPHRIVLNRNERNLGISGHFNRILELSRGELIVASDGDDVSRPERTDRCVAAWLRHDKPAGLVADISSIDASGAVTRDGSWFTQFFPTNDETPMDGLLRFSKEGSPALSTCSAAISREMCDAFGPLPEGIWLEDNIISMRAWLFDRILRVREPLVYYREHESNVSNRAFLPPATEQARVAAEQDHQTNARWRREALLGFAADLDLALRRGWITPGIYGEITRRIEARVMDCRLIEDWWNIAWRRRLKHCALYVAAGRLAEGRWCAPRLLPFSIFVSLAAGWSRLNTFACRRPDVAVRSEYSWIWIYPVLDTCTMCFASL
jgi:hypothetical protein